MLEEMGWVSVEERLPKTDLLLVLLRGSDTPALAVYVGIWKVQPLFVDWFEARDRVTHWQELSRHVVNQV